MVGFRGSLRNHMILGNSCSCTGNIGSYLLRVGQVVTDAFTGLFFTGVWTQISFTRFNRKLYGHGIQSFLLRGLSIALSIASRPYCQLFRGFELVPSPICCPDGRAIRRYIHSFPPHYTQIAGWCLRCLNCRAYSQQLEGVKTINKELEYVQNAWRSRLLSMRSKQ